MEFDFWHKARLFYNRSFRPNNLYQVGNNKQIQVDNQKIPLESTSKKLAPSNPDNPNPITALRPGNPKACLASLFQISKQE